MTEAAFAAFGGIIQTFAKFEHALALTLAHIAQLDRAKLLIIMQGLSYGARRDTLYSYMELYSTDPRLKSDLKGYFDAVNEYNGLRNHIAHSIWAPGIQPNSYRPMTVRIRGGKGTMLGVIDDGSENDYTDQELLDIGDKLTLLHNSFVHFALRLGM